MKISEIKNGDHLYDPELGFSVVFIGRNPLDPDLAVTLVGGKDLSMDNVGYLESLEIRRK